MNRFLTLTAVCLGLAPRLHAENEIGFAERFALAADREQALEQLVPGTEEYYFYHALQDQNTGQTEKLKAILKQWAVRIPNSAHRAIIENRQALLGYETDPKSTLAFLKDWFHLEFNDAQEARDQKPNLPSKLDPACISDEAFRAEAMRQSPNDLRLFTRRAIEDLIRTKATLSENQRHIALSKVTRPDVPNLVDAILADLESKAGYHFGDLPIHSLLLPDQLDYLARKFTASSLQEDQRFVMVRLKKLRPSADADPEFDAAEREAWLDRLWAYAKTLSPSFNTLKAQILFRRLVHDRELGVYDKARFLEYIKLPRHIGYINPSYLRKIDSNQPSVDFQAEADELPSGSKIGTDEWLVRDYLLHFFHDDASWQPYSAYIRDTYLKPLFAEAKLAAGAGALDEWSALLTPAALQSLKDRVDLNFAPTNPPLSLPGDAVKLDVAVKNVPKLIVRIYEINTLSFFLTQGRQLNTDVNLDGLVANSEQTLTFDDAAGRSPFRRSNRTIALPELSRRRGAWIVELIGGGKSSRALIRKGQFQLVQETGPSGVMITVFDEKRDPVPDAVAWVSGRKYAADAKLGRIIIPFTKKPGESPVILAAPGGDFASLASFHHLAEDYRLDAQFHIQREQLLAGMQATLAVKTTLWLGDQQIPPTLLEEPKLTIISKTIDGVATTREITAADGLALSSARELTRQFAVPERLIELTATLSAKVAQLSEGGEKRELVASRTWQFNGLDQLPETYDGRFVRTEAGYFLDVRGQNGEPMADQAVTFHFRHWDYENPISLSLRTDERGRVGLGALPKIELVTADLPNGRHPQEMLAIDDATWPAEVHAQAQKPIVLPWTFDGVVRSDQVSLLEMRGGVPVKEWSELVSVGDGAVTIKGLPVGDYELEIEHIGLRSGFQSNLPIKVTDGKSLHGWLLSGTRFLDLRNANQARIESAQDAGAAVIIQLRNGSPSARVQISASHFCEGDWSLDTLAAGVRNGPALGAPAVRPNLFVSGRAISDEERYILERRYAKLFPGNMLARPGLLLNPWEVRSTDVAPQGMKSGEALRRMAGDREPTSKPPSPEPVPSGAPGQARGRDETTTSLDFLATPGAALYNLVPDEKGVVRIDKRLLGDRQYVEIYAEDLSGACWKHLVLPGQTVAFRDRRLPASLDPKMSFAEKKEITPLQKGSIFTSSSAEGAEYEIYDSMGKVFALYQTLGHDAGKEFGFITRWPRLSEEEKRAKYTEFACHELNFFLSRKDPAFFRAVVQPYLRNKKEKTFMDDYLLEAELSGYLAPWAYARLNIAERALLAQRLPKEKEAGARHLRDLWESLSPDPERDDLLFETALRGRGLTGSGVEAESVPAALPASPDIRDLDRSGGAAGATMNGIASLAGKPMMRMKKMPSLGPADAAAAPPALPQELPVGAVLQDESELGETVRLRTAAVRAFYRGLGPTKEWAENNYYKRPLHEQNGELMPIDRFWVDFARWDGRAPFLSEHFAEAGNDLPELMLALGVLDLPFDAPKHEVRAENGKQELTAGGPLFLVHKSISAAAPAPGQSELLVSENFFRQSDRYRQEGNERFDKFVRDEFLAGVVYGGSVVVTNPASSPQRLQLLLQVPEGAIPVAGSKATDARHLHLDPYTTQTVDYFFYFPAPRDAAYSHHPAQVSRDGAALGAAKPFAFKVVSRLSHVDEESWDYVSQYGTDAQALAYLEKHNLQPLNLTKVAWRARARPEFFHEVVALLDRRHIYHDPIYAYALFHNDRALLGEYLRHHDEFISRCGSWLKSPLLSIDPIERRTYEQLEYAPLVNQRAHRVGAENKIANPTLRGQYQKLLAILAEKPALDDSDQMSVVYYLFLQDRVEEALARLKLIHADRLPTRLQYDYFRCYAAFYEESLPEARGLASQYTEYGVERWRDLFKAVLTQLDEIEAKEPAHVTAANPNAPKDGTQRERQLASLASGEPTFDFKVDHDRLELTWNRLSEVTVNYYRMDPEFLFSGSPFATADPERFAIVRPTRSERRPLPAETDHLEIALPEDLQHSNLLVEVLGAGQRKAHPYHANTLRLNIVENYGRLDVHDLASGKPVSRAYVKVYARLRNGQIRFYKDGYTDLRGIFDYASLNSGSGAEPPPTPQGVSAPNAGDAYQMLHPQELNQVEKLSILILSEAEGAAVREVVPPAE